MNVMPVIYKLIVNNSGSNTTEAVAPVHKVKEVPFKLFGVPRYDPVRVFARRFASGVVPSQLLETFGFDSISDCFGG
ncbi:hypothetical protein V6N12_001528 [Hibiscus sabdariffa]|uniref:Uncharacterized protein n=1 Tax=Hibiscus sabdariffa TaxID=183260 RepID=A0ABR2BQU1_9ROSI